MASYAERLAEAEDAIRNAELELEAVDRSRARIEQIYTSQSRPIPRKTTNHYNCRQAALQNHIHGWKAYIERGCVPG